MKLNKLSMTCTRKKSVCCRATSSKLNWIVVLYGTFYNEFECGGSHVFGWKRESFQDVSFGLNRLLYKMIRQCLYV